MINLEYIASSGSQYIDTGIIPDANTRVVCDFQLTQVDADNRVIFGCNGNSSGQFTFRKFNATVFRTNGGNSVNMPTTISMTDRHTVEKTATLTKVDGGNDTVTTVGVINKPLYLFAYNSGSAANFALVKIFSVQIYNGTTLQRDYKPKLDNGGAAGLYDEVTGQMFYNLGDGEFEFVLPTPEMPIASVIGATKTTVSISWNPVYCDGYNVYKDGDFVQTTVETSFLFSGLVSDTEYSFAVSAFNVVGESERSSVTVRTLAESPPAPPTITVIGSNDFVSLSFHSDGASEYTLSRDGSVIYSGKSELFEDHDVEPFSSYFYSCTASNEYGISDYSTLSVSVSTDNPLLYLITDRKQEDVNAVKELLKAVTLTAEQKAQFLKAMKGAYNADDMNRVESAAEYVRSHLLEIVRYLSDYMAERSVAPDSKLSLGVNVPNMTFKKNWSTNDIVSNSAAKRYIDNILMLINQVPVSSVIPETINNLTFDGANQIEQALLDEYNESNSVLSKIIDLVDLASDAFLYSGEIDSGEDIL